MTLVERISQPAFRLPLGGRGLVIAIPYLWLIVFFLLPALIVLKISFSTGIIGQPPYEALFSFVEHKYLAIKLNVSNYPFLFTDSLYWYSYVNALLIAAVSTFFCLLIGYPMAYGIARSSPGTRSVLLMLVIMPFWTSFLIRIYAWIGILKDNGLLNNLLIHLGVISRPLQIINTQWAVYIGIVYAYLPFMILPLYSTLEKMDLSLLEAAADLGCRPWKAFWRITFPLSLPGVIAGSLLVFIPATGEFVIPELLGGPDTLMIGNVLWNEFFGNQDWPVASTVAFVLLILLVLPIMLFQNTLTRQGVRVR